MKGKKAVEDFEMDNIIIFLETKIPNLSGPLELTKNIIYFNGNEKETDYEINDVHSSKSSYPFFTGVYKFPKDKLANKGMKDIINFFFDKDTFIDTLHEQEKSTEDESIVTEYNIDVMIKLIFPTVYPSEDENGNSYDKFINKKNTSIKGIIPFILEDIISPKKKQFSYIKIKNNIYTITSSCLLNDFLNHPEYRKLCKQFIDFDLWFEMTKREVKQKLISLKFTLEKESKNLINKKFEIKKEVFKNIRYKYTNIQYNEFIYDIDFLFNKLSNKLLSNDIIEVYIILKKLIFDDALFSKLKRKITEIKLLEEVNTNYFTEFHNSYENDEEVTKYLDSNYGKRNEFIEEIKKFSNINRTINNKKLQKLIDLFSDGKDNSFISYLMYLKNYYFDNRYQDITTQNKINNIGLRIGEVSSFVNFNTKRPKYQAYISLNLIGGELTAKNVNQITCENKNEELGTLFTTIGIKNKHDFITPTFTPLDSLFKVPKKIGGKKMKKKSKIKKTQIIKSKKISNMKTKKNIR